MIKLISEIVTFVFITIVFIFFSRSSYLQRSRTRSCSRRSFMGIRMCVGHSSRSLQSCNCCSFLDQWTNVANMLMKNRNCAKKLFEISYLWGMIDKFHRISDDNKYLFFNDTNDKNLNILWYGNKRINRSIHSCFHMIWLDW